MDWEYPAWTIQTVRLDILPIEIIHRIAAYGTFDSALSLLQVNHSLYSACNDWTVFQGIIKTNSSKWDLTPLSQQCEASTSSWARYALADYKATQLLNSNARLGADFAKWEPHLIAMHHDDVTRMQFYKDLLYPDNKYHKEVRLSRIFTDLQRFPGRAINNGRMTTPEFIESGTWAGYFWTNWSGGNYGNVKVDHALRDIHFTTTKNEAEANLLNLRSNKVLSGRMGLYHFEGKLSRASGKIDLVHSDGSEDEDKDINIYLQAIMTPFGIVATRAGGFRRTWMWPWKPEEV